MTNLARKALTRAVNSAIAAGSPVYVEQPARRTLTAIYDDWLAAESEWMAQIKAAFPGKRAGNVRYQKEGKGEPRTALRAAYEAWRRFGDEYRQAHAATREGDGVELMTLADGTVCFVEPVQREGLDRRVFRQCGDGYEWAHHADASQNGMRARWYGYASKTLPATMINA